MMYETFDWNTITADKLPLLSKLESWSQTG